MIIIFHNIDEVIEGMTMRTTLKAEREEPKRKLRKLSHVQASSSIPMPERSLFSLAFSNVEDFASPIIEEAPFQRSLFSPLSLSRRDRAAPIQLQKDRVPTFYTYRFVQGQLQTNAQGPHTVAHKYIMEYMKSAKSVSDFKDIFDKQISPYPYTEIESILKEEGVLDEKSGNLTAQYADFSNLEAYRNRYNEIFNMLSSYFNKPRARINNDIKALMIEIIEMHPYGSYGWERANKEETMGSELDGKGESRIRYSKREQQIDIIIDPHAVFKDEEAYVQFLKTRLNQTRKNNKIQNVVDSRKNLINNEIIQNSNLIKEVIDDLNYCRHIIYLKRESSLEEADKLFIIIKKYYRVKGVIHKALKNLMLIKKYHIGVVEHPEELQNLVSLLGEVYFEQFSSSPQGGEIYNKLKKEVLPDSETGPNPPSSPQIRNTTGKSARSPSAKSKTRTPSAKSKARNSPTRSKTRTPPAKPKAPSRSRKTPPQVGSNKTVAARDSLIEAILNAYNTITGQQNIVTTPQIKRLKRRCGILTEDFLEANNITIETIKEELNIKAEIYLDDKLLGNADTNMRMDIIFDESSYHYLAASQAEEFDFQETTSAPQFVKNSLIYAVYTAALETEGVNITPLKPQMIENIRLLLELPDDSKLEFNRYTIQTICKVLQIKNTIILCREQEPHLEITGDEPALGIREEHLRYVSIPDFSSPEQNSIRKLPRDNLVESIAAARYKRPLLPEQVDILRENLGYKKTEYIYADFATVRKIRSLLDIKNKIRIEQENKTITLSGAEPEIHIQYLNYKYNLLDSDGRVPELEETASPREEDQEEPNQEMNASFGTDKEEEQEGTNQDEEQRELNSDTEKAPVHIEEEEFQREVENQRETEPETEGDTNFIEKEDQEEANQDEEQRERNSDTEEAPVHIEEEEFHREGENQRETESETKEDTIFIEEELENMLKMLYMPENSLFHVFCMASNSQKDKSAVAQDLKDLREIFDLDVNDYLYANDYTIDYLCRQFNFNCSIIVKSDVTTKYFSGPLIWNDKDLLYILFDGTKYTLSSEPFDYNPILFAIAQSASNNGITVQFNTESAMQNFDLTPECIDYMRGLLNIEHTIILFENKKIISEFPGPPNSVDLPYIGIEIREGNYYPEKLPLTVDEGIDSLMYAIAHSAAELGNTIEITDSIRYECRDFICRNALVSSQIEYIRETLKIEWPVILLDKSEPRQEDLDMRALYITREGDKYISVPQQEEDYCYNFTDAPQDSLVYAIAEGYGLDADLISWEIIRKIHSVTNIPDDEFLEPTREVIDTIISFLKIPNTIVLIDKDVSDDGILIRDGSDKLPVIYISDEGDRFINVPIYDINESDLTTYLIFRDRQQYEFKIEHLGVSDEELMELLKMPSTQIRLLTSLEQVDMDNPDILKSIYLNFGQFFHINADDEESFIRAIMGNLNGAAEKLFCELKMLYTELDIFMFSKNNSLILDLAYAARKYYLVDSKEKVNQIRDVLNLPPDKDLELTKKVIEVIHKCLEIENAIVINFNTPEPEIIPGEKPAIFISDKGEVSKNILYDSDVHSVITYDLMEAYLSLGGLSLREINECYFKKVLPEDLYWFLNYLTVHGWDISDETLLNFLNEKFSDVPEDEQGSFSKSLMTCSEIFMGEEIQWHMKMNSLLIAIAHSTCDSTSEFVVVKEYAYMIREQLGLPPDKPLEPTTEVIERIRDVLRIPYTIVLLNNTTEEAVFPGVEDGVAFQQHMIYISHVGNFYTKTNLKCLTSNMDDLDDSRATVLRNLVNVSEESTTEENKVQGSLQFSRFLSEKRVFPLSSLLEYRYKFPITIIVHKFKLINKDGSMIWEENGNVLIPGCVEPDTKIHFAEISENIYVRVRETEEDSYEPDNRTNYYYDSFRGAVHDIHSDSTDASKEDLSLAGLIARFLKLYKEFWETAEKTDSIILVSDAIDNIPHNVVFINSFEEWVNRGSHAHVKFPSQGVVEFTEFHKNDGDVFFVCGEYLPIENDELNEIIMKASGCLICEDERMHFQFVPRPIPYHLLKPKLYDPNN